MKNFISKDVSTEVKCSACDGTGFPPVAQPAQAGRKIYPPPCKQCFGKGRINSAQMTGRTRLS
jgi:DnaJ-class molecular chaperone